MISFPDNFPTSRVWFSLRDFLFQVYDRCRGIDKDPVEPDPIPSRISSQLSLVPLITPAHCLGKPGEVREREGERDGRGGDACLLNVVIRHSNRYS